VTQHAQRLRKSRAFRSLLFVSGACLTIAACSPSVTPISDANPRPAGSTETQTSTPASPSSRSAPAAAGTAQAELDRLEVKGRAPMTGYDRNAFGPSWKDVDSNGCDTRNDILARDLVERQMNGSCVVLSGVLYPDPYTAGNITFVRGKSLVDIDHVVALGNAWVTGAFQWDTGKRESFANDPLNLLAVSASANRQKSDGDAATWLPSNKSYRCLYVARQIAVKSKYGLWVTSAEKNTMTGVLASCPNQGLPTDGTLPEPVPVPQGGVSPSPSAVSGDPVKFASCAAARAAGAAPIARADNPALYQANRRLDGDGDGIACE
jgi:hypothetical protein